MVVFMLLFADVRPADNGSNHGSTLQQEHEPEISYLKML